MTNTASFPTNPITPNDPFSNPALREDAALLRSEAASQAHAAGTRLKGLAEMVEAAEMALDGRLDPTEALAAAERMAERVVDSLRAARLVVEDAKAAR